MTIPPPAFGRVRLREGYDSAEVDAFVGDLLATWRGGSQEAERIEQARFTPTRLRAGYDMGEVDDYLDELRTLALQADGRA